MRSTSMYWRRLCAVAMATLVCGVVPVTVAAQTLRMGIANTPTIDPHFLQQDSNTAYNSQIYEALIGFGDNGETIPRLAVKWTAIQPTVWRFELRKGVVFQNGAPFSADDVVYSFDRVRNLPNNPAPYTSYLAGVVDVKKVDDYTVDITTEKSDPVLPRKLFAILIVCKAVAEKSETADFTSGKAAIGTGPYQVESYAQNEQLVLKRFDKYWGPKAEWEKVEMRLMPSAPSRMAALLAGEVDVIEQLSPNDAAALKGKSDVTVYTGATTRVAYLMPNVKLPNGGKSLFDDVNVRHAVSAAINRDALVQRMLGGFGTPLGQLAAPGMVGYNPDLKVPAYDPALAKKLLAGAGHATDLAPSFYCTKGRYLNDAQVCQAIVQMLAQVGVQSKLEALTPNVFFSRVTPASNPSDLSFSGWATSEGDTVRSLITLLHSYQPAGNLGAANRTGFVDAELDRLTEAAGSEMDSAKRVEFQKQAMQYAMDHYYVIPLYAQNAIFATRKNVTYTVGYTGWADKFQAMKVHAAH